MRFLPVENRAAVDGEGMLAMLSVGVKSRRNADACESALQGTTDGKANGGRQSFRCGPSRDARAAGIRVLRW